MQKVLIISGQTATGKTDLGVELSKRYNGEIVSFDSRQVYKYLDIITGKDFDPTISPSSKRIKNSDFPIFYIGTVPIWLYDLYDPKQVVNAFDFVQTANKVIQDIHNRNKLPIIVGGTMFYINGFLNGFEEENAGQDWDLRNKLEDESVFVLQDMLSKVNNDRLQNMNNSDRNNKRRLIRAIEIENNKSTKPSIQKIPQAKTLYNILHIGLVAPDATLKEKIKKRVLKRLDQGAINEIESLLKRGYTFADPGLNTNGYKQLKEYFEHRMTMHEAIEYWERGEIDHARRQLVYLKKMDAAIIDITQLIENTMDIVYKWI